MAIAEELLVGISLDTKNAAKGIEQLSGQLDDLQKTLRGVEKSTDGAESALTGFGSSIVVLNQSLELAKTAFRALVGPLKSAVNEFILAEEVENRLVSTLKLTGKFSEEAILDFKLFAKQLQETSRIGDEAALSLIALGKATGLTNEQAKQLTRISADVAAVTGKDLNAVFQELIGQLSGMPGRLQKIIPELADLTEEELRAGEGIDIIAKKFKGFSEAEVNTLIGSLAQLKNSFGDLSEDLGKSIVEAIKLPTIISGLKSGIDILSSAIKSMDFGVFAESIGFAAAALGGFLLVTQAPLIALVAGFGSLALAIDIVIRNITKLGDLFIATFSAMQVGLGSLIQTALEFVGLNKAAGNLEETLAEITERGAKAAESLDFGMAGEIVKGVQGAFKGLNKDLDKTIIKAETVTEKFGALENIKPKQIQFISEEQLKSIETTFGASFAGPIKEFSGSIGGFAEGVNALMGAIDSVLNFVQKLIDFIPGVLNKIANILNSLTDLPNKIANGISNVLDSIINFVKNFIPNILKGLENILVDLVDFLIEGLPKAFEELLAKLPDLIIGFLNRLPEIVEKLIIGLITAMPRIVLVLTESLIKDGPRIAIALVKTMAIELPKAIIKGLIEGGKLLIEMIAKFFTGGEIKFPSIGEDITNQFKEGLRSLTEKATSEASQLFAVIDIQRRAAGERTAQAIQNAIDSATMRFQGIFRMLWNWAKEFFQKWFIEPLMWVWDHIVKPIVDALTVAFQAIWENIIKPIVDLMVTTFQALWENIIKPIVDTLVNGLTSVWNFVRDKILDPLVNAGEKIWEGLKNAITGGFDFFKDLGRSIWNGLAGSLGSLGSGFGKVITDIFDKINPINLLKKLFNTDEAFGGGGTVEKIIQKIVPGFDLPFIEFAQGGSVPGRAAVQGDSPLNDRVLALLSPGEMVIPRSKMEDPLVASLIAKVLNGNLSVPKFALGGSLGEAFSSAGGSIGGTVGKVLEGDFSGAAEDVKNASFEQAGEDIQGVLDILNPQKILEKFKDAITDRFFDMISLMFEHGVSMHTGGLVPGFAFGGDVPALLKPGEFVMNNNAVEKTGLGAMHAINAGKSPMGETVINQNINLNMTFSGTPDENFIRQKMIPTIKAEFKRSSLKGEFLISERGIR